MKSKSQTHTTHQKNKQTKPEDSPEKQETCGGLTKLPKAHSPPKKTQKIPLPYSLILSPSVDLPPSDFCCTSVYVFSSLVMPGSLSSLSVTFVYSIYSAINLAN